MKQKLLLLSCVMLFFGTGTFAQVVFSEDFQSNGTNLPTGWLQRNVDNLTPAAQVAYFGSNAWIVRGDTGTDETNLTVRSTSYYSTPATADDWLWTPLISNLPANSILYWDGKTYDPDYPDGYEVRIMTSTQGPPTGGAGVIGNQLTGSTQIFTTAAETTTWTTHSVNLNSYTGQSVYIGFRNHSTDDFILLLDNVKVQVQPNNDVAIDSVLGLEYTMVPLSQTPTNGFPLSVRVKNNGLNTASGVTLTANIYNSSNVQLFTSSSSTVSINSGATAILATTANAVPPVADDYMIVFNVTMTGTDQVPVNNVDTVYMSITPSVYARDDGNVVGSIGIGAGNGGYIGQDFMMEHDADLNSIGIYYNAGYTGEKFAAAVWSMQADTPYAIIATTDTLIYPDDSARFYILPMHGGNIHLTAGRYAFTAIEFDSTMAVGQTQNIFTPGRTWIKWPTSPAGGWANAEDFGSSFAKTFVIRPVLCGAINPTITPTAASCGGSNGGAGISVTGDYAPFVYDWSNGDTAQTISGLAPGNYQVTVTDDIGCSATSTFSVSNNNLAITSTTSSTPAICTANNGGATVTPTNGTASYTYHWSNNANTASISNVQAGNYQVTVTDANGCSGSATVAVSANQTTLTSTTSSTPSSCSASTGGASVTVSNGTSPYTYLWSNQGNTSSISNLGPGNYQVTITDNNGCTGANTVTVGTPNGPTASASATNILCHGDSTGAVALLVNGGTAPITYNWSNSSSSQNLNNVPAGTYTVTVTDANQCSFTVSTTLSEPSALTVSGNATNATNGNNGAIDLTVTGGISNYTYSWSNNTTTQDLSGLAAGTYSVTVTDANSCQATATFSIISTGISETTQISSFSLFPNPANSTVQINLTTKHINKLTVELTDITGKIMWSDNAGYTDHYQQTINLSGFAAGVYLVRLNGEQVHLVQRLVIEK